MANKKKKLEDFLSGKKSAEGKKIFETWYHSVPENHHPDLEVSEEVLNEELKKIKGKNVVPLKPYRQNRFPYWKAAAIALLVISAGLMLATQQDFFEQEKVVFTEHTVPRGELLHLSLTDGSQVWLNAGSAFRYPEKFSSTEREVYLEGEAFFEVSKDAARPFRIHSGDLVTTVLGTSFNIKAYDTDHVSEVAVVTGKVSVVHHAAQQPSREVLLQPGQKVVMEKTTGKLSKDTFTDINQYTGWKVGKLIFENAPVGQVIESLGRYYNIEITLASDALRACHVTATFDPMPVEEVIYLLCFTLNAEYSKAGNQYQIQGKGCN